jgi:hypothetical protein
MGGNSPEQPHLLSGIEKFDDVTDFSICELERSQRHTFGDIKPLPISVAGCAQFP